MSEDYFVDTYEILDTLGEGGFATVFRARDIRDGNIVALKILRPQEGGYSPEVEQRFHREITIVSQLSHPNTVRLLNFGQSPDGTLFMVSEYLHGEDLHAVIRRRGTLEPEIVVHIVLQLLGSLAEAHRLGLLHRDIKPGNIRIIREDGDPYVVKVLDFGIARRMFRSSDDRITSDGSLVGTPRYMSPEQLTEGALTPASDIYSVGLVALEMLLGEDVLTGSLLQEQFERLTRESMLDYAAAERLGPHLSDVLHRMTARDPIDRFQSADAAILAFRNPSRTSRTLQPPPPQPPPQPQPTPQPRLLPLQRPQPQPQPPMPQHAPPQDAVAPKQRWVVWGSSALLVVSCSAIAWSLLRRPPEVHPPQQVTNITGLVATTTAEEVVPDAVLDVGHDVDVNTDADPDRADVEVVCPAPFTGLGYFSRGPLVKIPTYIPPSYEMKSASPLIVLLHSDLYSGEIFLQHTQMAEAAEAAGYVVVAPTASIKALAWDDYDSLYQDVVAPILADLCIDRSRVFLVGYRSGGELATKLSCEPWVAGVVSSSFRSATTKTCRGPKPTMLLHPASSTRLPLSGKTCGTLRHGRMIDHDVQVAAFAKKNRCGKSAASWGEFIQGRCEQYTGCNAPFVSCLVDGGLGWSNGDDTYVPQVPTIDCNDNEPSYFPASRAIVAFLDEISAGDAP